MWKENREPIVNLEGEIWKPVVGYEGLYEVSNKGRVKTLEVKKKRGRFCHTRPERLLIQRIKNDRYYGVALSDNNKTKHILVHRLVALAFVGNPENKPTVNHKNGIKSDNSADNLEWATIQEQIKHSWENGLATYKGENSVFHKLTEKQVLEIRAMYVPRKMSARKISKLYNVHYSCIDRIIRKETWKHI